MARFDVVVDTKPMAKQVENVITHVYRIGNSVKKMNDQLVEAEKQSADMVSKNVTYGFYMLTKSGLSQKMVEFQSQLSNYLININRYQKELHSIRDRMEHDYNTISQQYLRIFHDIDTSLKQSIKEIDKGLYSIASESKDEMNARVLKNVGKLISYSDDILPLSQVLVVGKEKTAMSDIIQCLYQLLIGTRKVSAQMAQCLQEDVVKGDGISVYTPLLVHEESSFINPDYKIISVSFPSYAEKNDMGQNEMKATVSKVTGSEDHWVACDTVHRERVKMEYLKKITALEPRRQEMMASLFNASDWKEFKG